MAQIQIRANKQIMAGSITNNEIANSTIALAKLAQGADIILRDGSVAMTGALNMGGQLVSSVASPVANTDAATKGYVDQEIANLSAGLEYKGSLDLSLQNENNIADGQQGDFYKISTGGTMLGVTYEAGDMIIFNKTVVGVPTAADIDKVDNTEKSETASTTSYANNTSGLAATDVQAAIDEVEGRVDTAESNITTLNGDVNTAGSVLKTVKDNAENATNTSNVSGTTVKDAFDTVDASLDTLNGTVATAGSVLKSIKDNAESATSTSTVGTGTVKGDLDKLASDLTIRLSAQNDAIEISYDSLTSALKEIDGSTAVSNVQGAIDALDRGLDSAAASITTLEGTGAGSVAKAEADAKAYTDTAVANLVDSSPALLDTLNELAAAINDDPNFATTVANDIAAAKTELKGTVTAAYDTLGEVEVELGNLGTRVTTLETNQGSLASLNTTAKSNLVAAINEVAANASGATGDLSTLTTVHKSTVVGAINEVDANTDTNTAAIATINGSGAGSISKALQDAKDYTDAETAKEVYAEAPIVTDASTDVTLANTPASIKGVYLNGLRTAFYSIVGGVISFTEALETGDVVYVDYVKA